MSRGLEEDFLEKNYNLFHGWIGWDSLNRSDIVKGALDVLGPRFSGMRATDFRNLICGDLVCLTRKNRFSGARLGP